MNFESEFALSAAIKAPIDIGAGAVRSAKILRCHRRHY